MPKKKPSIGSTNKYSCIRKEILFIPNVYQVDALPRSYPQCSYLMNSNKKGLSYEKDINSRA